jgi:ribosome-associated protein
MKPTKQSLEGRQLIDFLAKGLFEHKAEDVRIMDLRNLSDITDYFVVATCQSEVQMRAIVNDMSRDLRTAGVRPMGTDYQAGVRWAVMDLGEVILHLFEESAREFYSLERLWSDSKTEVLQRNDYLTAEDIKQDDDEFF